ncbi:DNA polymerase IV [Phytohabitans rumicis]|uniref:DNA polymerase IV n=1 Tax=Phytohabitans rumicis TaxID=1076125 RepID=A0A6V8LLB1_9ACTN|nr:DNA polymerase IV [Phytohabitans rumicis]GFJ94966.1 DNA polymerase IV [Phytohabitans rumicis]
MGPWWLLHVDLDQFVAAVEVLRRPELRGRPVVVGGDGDPTRARQVVATASYEARAFGVRSGMPLRAAFRRCPEAVFLPSDPPVYEAASARVMATLRSFPVRVEVWGWDEAFVGAEVADPWALAADLRRAVLDKTGLSCAIGIGDNKTTAKIAARFGKPGGIYELTAGNWMAVMGERPAGELWGIGPKTAAKLTELGLHTVADLATADADALRARFGPRQGAWLLVLARGLGDTEIVTEPWIARSRSRETTYPRDLTDREEIAAGVAVLARELGAEIVGAGRRVTHVAVKVRFASFYTPTRVMKLRDGPTTDVAVIERAALIVLEKFRLDRPVRLLGVRVDLAMDD